ncbi:minor curlin subunit [Pseudoalteromonas citrea]|uniref:Minor curlin subunit n=2 Tax=Pseudoalteromonas citrea TaxID=43655 RepID=A0AAD4AM50_9GAMM|nr:curlin subunit CsgB [Pseudoalteromonas citrea]KAF7775206.1 minor curlin subunit [Pseudoalteromonas citrea]
MVTSRYKSTTKNNRALSKSRFVPLLCIALSCVSLKMSAKDYDLKESPLSISIHPSFVSKAQHINTHALVNQIGTFNKATIFQSNDELNSINVQQLGTGNLADITQLGSNNRINLLQQGSYNSAVIIQEGNANIVNLTQLGQQSFIIHQQGNDMVVDVSVTK